MAVRRWSAEQERQCSTPAPVVLAERQWGGAQTGQGGCTPKGGREAGWSKQHYDKIHL